MKDIKTNVQMFKGNYYKFITINESPFIVICAQSNFNKGFISIYSALYYSVKEANENFELSRNKSIPNEL